MVVVEQVILQWIATFRVKSIIRYILSIMLLIYDHRSVAWLLLNTVITVIYYGCNDIENHGNKVFVSTQLNFSIAANS
jgi:hypothetical protein